MIIYLPFVIRGVGGTASFALKFKAGIEAYGHKVYFKRPAAYDLLFLVVQCPLKDLLDARRRGVPIVQRLDGVYYWTVAGPRFPLMNAKATYIRHLFADLTIYQSRYSQESVQRFLGLKPAERAATIYNGVDLNRFSPRGIRHHLHDNSRQRVFFTASAFRRTDQIMPLIAAIEAYRRHYSENAKLVVAGTFAGPVANVPSDYQGLPHIQFLGKVNNEQLPAYHRAADVFVMTHLNPPCPNNVIEAMACGLPICGVADGAMTELVEPGRTGMLLPTQGTGYWRARFVEPRAFARNMHDTYEQRFALGSAATRRAQVRFGLSHMVNAYIKAFKHEIRGLI